MSDFEHDLASFMAETNSKVEQDYLQIRKRVKEDPGTAGDQVEETWAELLRNWLPSKYKVVTKGRVLGVTGDASPQVDILILSPSYPTGLIGKKLYLACGVVAAFECKLTLRPRHLEKIFQTRAKLNQVTEREWFERRNLKRSSGQIYAYEEYHGLFDFGILAHSHEGFNSPNAVEDLTNKIRLHDRSVVKTPKNMLDLVCVNGLACVTSQRSPYRCFSKIENDAPIITNFGIQPTPISGYDVIHQGLWHSGSSFHKNFSPIGAFIARLWKKLSFNDPEMIGFSRYYTTALATGISMGLDRMWPEIPTPHDLWSRYEAMSVNLDFNDLTMVHYRNSFLAF